MRRNGSSHTAPLSSNHSCQDWNNNSGSSTAAGCPLNELSAAHSSLFHLHKFDSYTSSHQLKIILHQCDRAEKPVLHYFMLHLSGVDTNPNEVGVGVASHRYIELLANL